MEQPKWKCFHDLASNFSPSAQPTPRATIVTP